MANKITQLVNKSGDNLYPLAGGMAAGSVTTSMIADNAITSDKIDFTTFEYSTEERAVGQDYDGAIIYEQTFVGTFSTSSNNTATSVILVRPFNGRIIDASGQITVANSAGVLRPVEFGSAYVGAGTNFTDPQCASSLFRSTGTSPALQAAIYAKYATADGGYRITARYTKN